MPVIRVSNEAYKKLLELQARDGNTMSVFMDRLLAKIEAGEGLSEKEMEEGAKAIFEEAERKRKLRQLKELYQERKKLEKWYKENKDNFDITFEERKKKYYDPIWKLNKRIKALRKELGYKK